MTDHDIRDPIREAARLRAIHTPPPHRHTWTPIDGTIFAASYAQPDTLVCLEDGATRIEVRRDR